MLHKSIPQCHKLAPERIDLKCQWRSRTLIGQIDIMIATTKSTHELILPIQSIPPIKMPSISPPMSSRIIRSLRQYHVPVPRSSRLPRPQRRAYIPAPTANSGQLMSRRSDRELPALNTINNPFRIWRHLPILIIVIGASAAGIFNYQKVNHSVVNSSLFALRMNPVARERLGDEIYFRDRIPWISGTIDSLHGEVDVKFGVKGKSGKGVMRFRCVREPKTEFVSHLTGVAFGFA